MSETINPRKTYDVAVDEFKVNRMDVCKVMIKQLGIEPKARLTPEGYLQFIFPFTKEVRIAYFEARRALGLPVNIKD